MRRWIKFTFIGVSIVCVAALVVGGTGAYFVFKHLERREATEPQTKPDFDAIRARFGNRQPLIELVDPAAGDIRINRQAGPENRHVQTIHVLAWKAEDEELVRTEIPLWLMRFSTLNLLSQLGIAPAKFRLTVADVERYGPGIVVDYQKSGSTHVLLWVD